MRLVRQKILKDRPFSRETLLDKKKVLQNDDRVANNITCYPIYENIREFKYGFKCGANLKDHLVSSFLPKAEVAGNSGPCGGKKPHRKLCMLMKKNSNFKKQNCDETYHISKTLKSNLLKDDTHVRSMKTVQFSRPPPHPLVHLRSKFFHPLDFGRPISSQPLLLEFQTNREVENFLRI